jgi:hypothetical protein
MKCPYCDKPAKLVTGSKIYPHRVDLFSKKFYLCESCDAYVGCHKSTDKPLGRLANKELRALKMKAHEAFDPRWRSGEMTRSDAYAWLAGELGVSKSNCHIGMFDEVMCQAVINVCKGE